MLPATCRSSIGPSISPGRWSRTLQQVDPAAGGAGRGELWPNFLLAAQRADIPVAVINGRMSPRSAARYRRLRGLDRRPVRLHLDLYAVQTEEYADDCALARRAPRSVHVTGSVKYEAARATATTRAPRNCGSC